MTVIKEKTTKELFQEITDHLLGDHKPSEYINALSKDEAYNKHPFTLLWKLKDTEQSKKYHPEGSVWNHTMLVLDEAAKVREDSKDPMAFMWAALLHDIGKPQTTRIRKGRITSYDHDKAGERLSVDFLEYFIEEEVFVEKVSALVRYHMHMLYVLKKLPYSDIKGLLNRVDINDLTLLCLCDRMGRTGADIETEDAMYNEFRQLLNRMT